MTHMIQVCNNCVEPEQDLKAEVVVDAGCYTLDHCKGLVSALRGTGTAPLP